MNTLLKLRVEMDIMLPQRCVTRVKTTGTTVDIQLASGGSLKLFQTMSSAFDKLDIISIHEIFFHLNHSGVLLIRVVVRRWPPVCHTSCEVYPPFTSFSQEPLC